MLALAREGLAGLGLAATSTTWPPTRPTSAAGPGPERRGRRQRAREPGAAVELLVRLAAAAVAAATTQGLTISGACGGRGCLELFAGQEAILRAAGLHTTVSTSTRRSDGPVSVLVERLDGGDRLALDALALAGLVTARMLERPGALLSAAGRA